MEWKLLVEYFVSKRIDGNVQEKGVHPDGNDDKYPRCVPEGHQYSKYSSELRLLVDKHEVIGLKHYNVGEGHLNTSGCRYWNAANNEIDIVVDLIDVLPIVKVLNLVRNQVVGEIHCRAHHVQKQHFDTMGFDAHGGGWIIRISYVRTFVAPSVWKGVDVSHFEGMSVEILEGSRWKLVAMNKHLAAVGFFKQTEAPFVATAVVADAVQVDCWEMPYISLKHQFHTNMCR